MSRNTAARAALLALVLALAGTFSTSAASAATVTLQPSPAEARTFATTNGGWSSAVDYNGLVCIPGVTCPSANPTYQATNGAGGAGDGFLRNSFGTLLGVLSTTTISWSSPTFVAPANTSASLSFKVRPQIASLLAIGSVNVTASLVDVADGTQTTTLPATPLTAASSSFSTINLTVPPGAVVAGRTYRVRIATALATAVSAVTSGNVDLDDVVLTLTDAILPTGLTASVPASGPTRVVGSVDAQGLNTDVTVDYGPTNAYGSTTTAVPISGSTSGSQPFSIPLTGLTPGATYHYRVNATNTDGTVRTTDATFVAPSAPSTAAPSVSGAATSPTRTVTFTRAADVTSAVVELLNSGGTVIDSYPDSDGDGSVGITLPADGNYSVRVVRTNDAGLSSTSTSTPLLLDRAGPDVSGLNLTVTPAASSAAQRSVTFVRPADAATVTAQVIDANDLPVGLPVTAIGGSATVTLGASDGAYRVRLTLADASGNEAQATSSAVTLDTAAPNAGPAPTVTGASNDRNRTVTFTRAPDATTVVVEILNGGGSVIDTIPVASGSSTPITLPNTDGNYSVRVKQTDAAGNSATSPGTPVLLDRSAPDLTGLALALTPSLSNDRDRTVSIVRPADAATVTAQVIDANGDPVGSPVTIAGTSATVTLGAADGAYRVRVTVADAAGNSDSRTSGPVTLDTAAPDAGPAPTVTGADTDRDRTVTFTRAPDASTVVVEVLDGGGSVIDTIPVPSGNSTDVTLPNTDGSYSVRVKQTDAAGNSATSPGKAISLDRSAPDLSALGLTLTPSVSNDQQRTVTIVRPADAATVTAQVIDANGDPVGSPVTVTGNTGTVTLGASDGAYRVVVTVADAAGNSDDRTSAAVTLDTAAPDAGPAPTVTGASNSRDRTVTFTRAPDAANVTIELLDGSGNVIDTFPVANGSSGPITLPTGDGTYRVRVKQTDAAGNSATTPTTELTLDRTGPNAGPAPTVTGPPDDLTVTFVRAPDAVNATIEVRDSNGTLVVSVPVPTGNSGTVHLPAGVGQYTISVVQFDADGNSGTTPSVTVERPAAPGNPGGGNPGGGNPGGGNPGAGTPPVAGPPTQRDPGQLDRCNKPSLVLTGVTLRNGRARISGWTASDPGTKVAIQDQARKQVATATVEASGSFTATVRPRAGVKRTALRYYAVLGGKRSIGLQLLPANTLTNVVRTGSTLTLRGRIDLKRIGAIRSVDAIGGTGDCPGTTTGFTPLGKPTINRRTGSYRLQVRADEGGRLIVRTRVTGTRNRARSGYLVR